MMYRYWGKASKDDNRYHLLVYHSLDVAAVGYQLLHQSPVIAKNLSSLLGMEVKPFIRWMVFFLALHDLGKFADSFQNLRPDLLFKLKQRKSKRAYCERHDNLGYLFWKEVLKSELAEQGLFNVGSGRRQTNEEVAIDFWMLAVTGHHGQPPENKENFILRSAFEEAVDIDAAINYVKEAGQLFLCDDNKFPLLDQKRIKQASWWLSGFTVLCDWLGSSRHVEAYAHEPMPLSDYWDEAKYWADGIIRRNEIIPAIPAQDMQLSQLFGAHITDAIELTPLQSEVSKLQINNGPQLFILEDVTGAGKTEAAMILLRKLMAANQSNGFYFGLPTMATANAMYQRMADVYRNLYSAETSPSLVLAHSASKLNEKYRQSFSDYSTNEARDNGDDTETASSHCSQWLTDNRKKALLAEAGVGTIDQALLAILPSRYQSLRLLGLLGKVLIVDEVHACDAYMNTLLCGLLKAHSSTGGSAILLSATLPQNQRQQLVNEFTAGLSAPEKVLKKTAMDDYPLITHVHSQGINEMKVATRSNVKRKVKVQIVNTELQVFEVIVSALEQGQCICWIRNTVKDARHALHQFQKIFSQFSVDLFHARFTMGDRLRIENNVLRMFGPNSDAGSRRGRLLIATQVVEQSLDLDFDLMVTDLAPIDLIIQRAGRLCRHQRDGQGNRIQQSDQRGTAKLIIHSPVWQDDPAVDWLKLSMPGTAAVYEYQDGQLWQGLKLLRDAGEFNMPEDARILIEGVYSDESADELPEGLSEAALQQEACQLAENGQGRMNLLKLELGYKKEEQNIWWDEAKTPTRLGDETSTVYLARWQDKQLSPWIANGSNQWANSALSMRKDLVDSEVVPSDIPEAVIAEIKQQLPAQGKYGVLMILKPIEDFFWTGEAKNEKGESMNFYYQDQQGLLQANEYEERR